MIRWAVAVVVVALGLPLTGKASRTNCREVEIFSPPDGIETVEVCDSDCQEPLDPDEVAQCGAALCDKPGAGESDLCRRAAGCRNDEEVVEGECRPIFGNMMAQADECIASTTLQRIEKLVKKADQAVEQRLRTVTAFAVSRFIKVSLPDGKQVSIAPGEDSADSVALRRSVEAFARKQGIACKAGMLGDNCSQPLIEVANKQGTAIDGEGGLFDQIEALTNSIRGPKFDECLQNRDPGTLKFSQLGMQTTEMAQTFRATAQIGGIILAEPDRIRVNCQKADISTCEIEATEAPPQPPRVAPIGRR